MTGLDPNAAGMLLVLLTLSHGGPAALQETCPPADAMRLLLSALALVVILVMADAQEAPNALILEDGEKKSVSMGRGDSPVLFCYPGPRFNVWRSWEDVTFEISGSPFLPKVFGASEDDVHGLLDALLKSYIAGNEESVTDIMTKIEKRAISRTEYIPSLFDLLSECPPIWDSRSTTCTKVFSPFGRSCIALSVPNKSPDGKAEVNVKVKVSFQQTFPAIMLAGLSLMYLARFFSKSKILWYSSGISVSVLLGLVILVVFLCRKVRCKSLYSDAILKARSTRIGTHRPEIVFVRT
jgi:hypothetical protein